MGAVTVRSEVRGQLICRQTEKRHPIYGRRKGARIRIVDECDLNGNWRLS